MRKNKILFVNSSETWGGGEKWHYENAIELFNNGFDVYFMTGRRSVLCRKIKKDNDLKLVEFKITNLSFLNIFLMFKIFLFIKKNKINHLILNLPSDLKAVGIAAKIAGARNIIYRRGSAIPIKNRLFNRFLFRKIVTDIIANSEETKRTVLSNNRNLFPEEKIFVLYNGINTDKNFKGSSKNISKDKIVIGNLGRLCRQKAQEYLIDLGVELSKKSVGFEILIGGSGERYAEILNMIEANQLEDKIKMLGFVEDVEEFFNRIDLFVLTSKWEGFGYVMVEAMRYRKPVIAFDVSSNAEIVKNDETGFLIKPFDIKKLSERIIFLKENIAIASDFGTAGAQRVKEKFDFKAQAKKLEEYILEMNHR